MISLLARIEKLERGASTVDDTAGAEHAAWLASLSDAEIEELAALYEQYGGVLPDDAPEWRSWHDRLLEWRCQRGPL